MAQPNIDLGPDHFDSAINVAAEQMRAHGTYAVRIGSTTFTRSVEPPVYLSYESVPGFSDIPARSQALIREKIQPFSAFLVTAAIQAARACEQ